MKKLLVLMTLTLMATPVSAGRRHLRGPRTRVNIARHYYLGHYRERRISNYRRNTRRHYNNNRYYRLIVPVYSNYSRSRNYSTRYYPEMRYQYQYITYDSRRYVNQTIYRPKIYTYRPGATVAIRPSKRISQYKSITIRRNGSFVTASDLRRKRLLAESKQKAKKNVYKHTER